MGFWSTISSPIYLPVMPILQHQFKVTEEQLNLTVVVYSIFQGLAPVLFSNLADQFGRRLIVITCLTVYILANVGLALNNTYPGLIVLRCIQAFGIALTVTVGSGIASDITTKSERGSFIGITTGLSLLGQAFGALIGGLIENSFGWRAIFWFLVISAGASLILVFTCLPETSRPLVGNGSNLPSNPLNRAPIFRLPKYRTRLVNEKLTIQEKKKFTLLAPFKILRNTPTYMTLIPSSISYTVWLMMLTTLSTSLSKSYGYNTLHIGLSYIPSGLGGLLGSVTSGKLLDYSYKKEFKKYIERNEQHIEFDRYSGETEEHRLKTEPFNFIWARLVLTIIPTLLSIIGSLIFGWSIYCKLHVAVPLLGSFLVSYAAMNYLTISTTFIVDLNPSQTSGSSSTVNLTRCWCAALFIACLSQMVDSMTVGGCYTFMGGLLAISSLTIPYILINSLKWLELT